MQKTGQVGILNAIHPQKSVIDWGGLPVDAYIRFFQDAGAPFTFVGYEVAQGQLPASPDECDAYVITGSSNGVYDLDAWIPELMAFVRESYRAGKKLVGICFGHQILAHALGGHAEKSEKGWGLGLKKFSVLQSKPWMTDGAEQCSLHFAHQDQVVALPPQAELLGGNAFCPNAFFVIGDQVLGIQGHPEFTRSMMEDLLGPMKTELEPVVHETAVSSLSQGTPDNELVGKWLVNFLANEYAPVL
ncbi:MAG: GMP synthase [Ardenticatenaceae bacterium]|nr:GMP synthase [Ardenticatenaceae bacterium]